MPCLHDCCESAGFIVLSSSCCSFPPSHHPQPCRVPPCVSPLVVPGKPGALQAQLTAAAAGAEAASSGWSAIQDDALDMAASWCRMLASCRCCAETWSAVSCPNAASSAASSMFLTCSAAPHDTHEASADVSGRGRGRGRERERGERVLHMVRCSVLVLHACVACPCVQEIYTSHPQQHVWLGLVLCTNADASLVATGLGCCSLFGCSGNCITRTPVSCWACTLVTVLLLAFT